MDMASIQAAMTSLQAATNIASGLVKLKSGSELQAKVAELNAEILSAQTSALKANSDQFALLQEVRGLKEEIARMKAWETEQQRYQLHEAAPGILTRRLKAGMENGEIMHEVCATCFENQKKSPLQRQRAASRMAALLCPSCKTSLTFYD